MRRGRTKAHRLRIGGMTSIAVLTTFVCMMGSVAWTWFLFQDESFDTLQKAMVSSMFLPVFAGLPAFYMLLKRFRALNFRNLRLQAIARRDGLTNCFNKMAFKRVVEGFLEETEVRNVRKKGALLIIDADHFKHINDTLGHEAGDEAIKAIAHRIKSVVRRKDSVGRIGGEEFAVLLRDADDTIAASVAERIRLAVGRDLTTQAGHTVPLTVSIGGAVFADEVQFTTLFRDADSKLYQAKANGRNRVEMGAVQVGSLAA